MRILVVNPNTTASMTRKIDLAAKAVASRGVEIVAVNPEFGPPSIEGYYDEAFAIPGLIAEREKAGGEDATVIACFDDTGLEAARSFSPRRSSELARRRSISRVLSPANSAS
jgi:allantoin racemase